jgi:hypothetical protein
LPSLGRIRILTCISGPPGTGAYRAPDRIETASRDGGIGRRAGLKNRWPQGHEGSSPSLGTRIEDACGRGGIGRRAWFRTMSPKGGGGSSPLDRTTYDTPTGCQETISRGVLFGLRDAGGDPARPCTTRRSRSTPPRWQRSTSITMEPVGSRNTGPAYARTGWSISSVRASRRPEEPYQRSRFPRSTALRDRAIVPPQSLQSRVQVRSHVLPR